MKKIVPKAKLSKKARRKLNAEKRTTWAFSPVTKRVESKKVYNRKKIGSSRFLRESAAKKGCKKSTEDF